MLQNMDVNELDILGGSMLIVEDDLTGEAVRALLALHWADMHEHSPPEMAYVLDIEDLKAPGVTFWSIWGGDDLLGFGALKTLASDWGEIKSMRTHPDHLGKGAGAAMLDHIISTARQRGFKRLSLETGTGPYYDAALSLYRKCGFENGESFAGYATSDFNQFLHLDL